MPYSYNVIIRLTRWNSNSKVQR